MKTFKLYTFLFLMSFSFFQCQEKVEVIHYEVTPEFCKKIDKPEVHFSVDIPINLNLKKPEEGKRNYSYGMIKKIDENKEVLEMCSFGYIKLEGSTEVEKNALSFLERILGMLKGAGYEFETAEIAITNFDGKKYATLQGIATMKEGLNEEFVGRFYFNSVTLPNPKDDTHIILLMQARDDQNISNYNDFSDKLDISRVWSSFEYK